MPGGLFNFRHLGWVNGAPFSGLGACATRYDVLTGETMEACVERLVLEYAQSVPPSRPLAAQLSLRDDLAIESLSLVSLALRLGGEFDVDIVELGLELRDLRTFGDLVHVARTLEQQGASNSNGAQRS
jgi:acyl carrier protein